MVAATSKVEVVVPSVAAATSSLPLSAPPMSIGFSFPSALPLPQAPTAAGASPASVGFSFLPPVAAAAAPSSSISAKPTLPVGFSFLPSSSSSSVPPAAHVFGAPAVVSGFSFPSAMSSSIIPAAIPSSSSSTTATVSTKKGECKNKVGVMSKTAGDYIKELGLDEDMTEEVEEEMMTADKAWCAYSSDSDILVLHGVSSDNVGEDEHENENVLEKLVTKLGTTYDDEEHGIALRHLAALAGDNKRELHKEAFVGWYMRLLFEDDGEGEDYDDEDDSNVEEKSSNDRIRNKDQDNSLSVTPTTAIASALGSLSIFGGGIANSSSSSSSSGKTWKCDGCMVSNAWEVSRCPCCNTVPLHGKDMNLFVKLMMM